MDREAFTESIRVLKHRSPFRPFTIVTVAGNRHEVDHPDTLAINDGLAVLVGPGGVPVIFDYDGVSEILGDLSGRGKKRNGRPHGGS